MEGLALGLMTDAMRATIVLALPAVVAVAAVGVIIAIIQTIVQVQDQNVAFAPKLATIALLAWCAGPLAFELIRTLLVQAITSMPALVHA